MADIALVHIESQSLLLQMMGWISKLPHLAPNSDGPGLAEGKNERHTAEGGSSLQDRIVTYLFSRVHIQGICTYEVQSSILLVISTILYNELHTLKFKNLWYDMLGCWVDRLIQQGSDGILLD